MEVIEQVSQMERLCAKLRSNGRLVRLVPTMGALHAGHATLIECACREARSESRRASISHSLSSFDDGSVIGEGDSPTPSLAVRESETPKRRRSSAKTLALKTISVLAMGAAAGGESTLFTERLINIKRDLTPNKKVVVIVSIFVNPLQFDNSTDLDKYPSTFESDLRLCRQYKVNYVFAPKPVDILGSERDRALATKLLPPQHLASQLEGKFRPGHFAGMLQIVCKLFNICRPHEAYFGEKDYQQMLLVSRMSHDLSMGVSIRPIPTVRDPLDMLPLSSRNVRLTKDQRQLASLMYKILSDARDALEAEQIDSNRTPRDINTILLASMMATRAVTTMEEDTLIRIDYLELRCASDLGEIHHVPELDCYDCQHSCVERSLSVNNCDRTLKARLLISLIVGQVRLLDNIEISLNLYN